MKNKLNNFRGKKYFLLFVLVMALNTLLTISLLRVSFAQTKKDNFLSQSPVKVGVTEQKNNPLRIVVVNVDNSFSSYQDIVFSLQNISDKPIKAYTLLLDGKRSGKVTTSFLTTKRFPVGESVIKNLEVERSNITEGETILISVDYVEFEDRSSWGKDTTGNSKLLAGQREGTKTAVTELKNLSRNQSANSIINFLKQDIQDITIDIPNTNQSDEWKRGFRLGYKSIVSILQEIEEEKIEKILEKLDEMEKIANQGDKL